MKTGRDKNENRGYFCPAIAHHFSKAYMQTLHQFQESFDAYLKQNQFNKPPYNLYEPADYILALGGKRLRPALLLAGHFLFDDDFERSLPAAFAIEVFHNFSLVHDDIMDAAPLRRGKPTVHNKFGLNAGVLSGDVMLALAYDYLLNADSPNALEVTKKFSKMAIEVCEGQQMDMDFETQSRVEIADYLKMIELKTAVLVATALEIGALIGGGDEKNAKSLYDFGRNLGIAFQLQDDILDAYGDPKKFGKKPGGDIAQNKKTYLYLKALEVAPVTVGTELFELFNKNNQDEAAKIATVISIFNKLDIRNLAEKKKEEYWQAALSALGQVDASSEKKALLEGFAKNLMDRES